MRRCKCTPKTYASIGLHDCRVFGCSDLPEVILVASLSTHFGFSRKCLLGLGLGGRWPKPELCWTLPVQVWCLGVCRRADTCHFPGETQVTISGGTSWQLRLTCLDLVHSSRVDQVTCRDTAGTRPRVRRMEKSAFLSTSGSLR